MPGSIYIKVIQPFTTYAMWVGLIRQSYSVKTLERQHCRTARIMFGFSTDMPTVDILAAVKWRTLKHLYKCSLIKPFYNRGFHGMFPRTLQEGLIVCGNRSSSKLKHGLIASSFAFK